MKLIGEPSEQFRGSHEGGLYCTADFPCGLDEGKSFLSDGEKLSHLQNPTVITRKIVLTLSFFLKGDCNKDKECQGDLLCGMNNCKKSFFNAEDDCCEEPPSSCVDTTACFGEVSDPKGEHYDGCVNTTVSGRTCQVLFRTVDCQGCSFPQAWASTSPHSHRFTSNARLVGNYCRNPDGEPGPW